MKGGEKMLKQELKAVMVRYGDTQAELAKYLKMSTHTLSVKLNGMSEFTRPEIEKIALRYSLSAEDIQRIFFIKTVAQQAI